MKSIWVSFLFLFSIAFLSTANVSSSTAVFANIPPYVVPIIVMDEIGKDVGLATAVLIDSEEGLFATSAHVVAFGKKLEIRLGSEWHPVESQEEWINWSADLAIVRVDPRPRLLPQAVVFGEIPIIGSHVLTIGYVSDTERIKEGRDSFIVSRSVKGKVEKLDSGHGISLGSQVALLLLVVEIVLSKKPVWECANDFRASYEPGSISKLDVYRLVRSVCSWEELSRDVSNEQKLLFYRNYIQVDRLGEEMAEYRSGLSGSPVLSKEGQLLGIHSSANANGGRAIVIPVEEIKTLIRRIQRQ